MLVLRSNGSVEMGFDVRDMNIMVRTDVTAPGGAAFDVSIPDDVRFFLNAQPGFEGARGYFHELGHAIHMKLVQAKHLPAKTLPQDRALNEGIGEIFGLIPRLPDFVRKEFQLTSLKNREPLHLSRNEVGDYALLSLLLERERVAVRVQPPKEILWQAQDIGSAMS